MNREELENKIRELKKSYNTFALVKLQCDIQEYKRITGDNYFSYYYKCADKTYYFNCGDTVVTFPLFEAGDIKKETCTNNHKKFITIDKADFENAIREAKKSRERVFNTDTLKDKIKDYVKEDIFLKKLKQVTDITLKIRATYGKGNYRGKYKNEILTDEVTVLVTKPSIKILCDKKSKAVLINRVQQQPKQIDITTDKTDIQKENEILLNCLGLSQIIEF